MSRFRTETIGNAELILGDCREVLPTLPTVDAVVTSPPYNLVKEGSGGSTTTLHSHERRYSKWYPDELPEGEYQEQQRALIAQLQAVCRGSIFYNHKVRYAIDRRGEVYHPRDWLSDFVLWCEIVWDRGGYVTTNVPRYGLQDERIYQIGRPAVWNGSPYGNVWRIPPDKGSGHVCAFPVELARRCILPSTDEGHTVLDPYAGSGTVGVACAQTGRKFIGCEIDPGSFEIALRRIEKAYEQPSLFSEPPPRPVQRSLLAGAA